MTPEAAREAARGCEQPAFIRVLDDDRPTTDGPLSGLPFAVKDNIDVAGVPSTAACPARVTPAVDDAVAVGRLVAAGAIPMAKTNMDQFATGLVGTRSPYGACSSVYDEARVSGGSSSGSAVAVALGIVPLALGTDTAGSGRVPAAFNGLVGMKPTRGLISTTGVLPACRSLDVVTTLTRTVAEARTALTILTGYDGNDAYSRRPPIAGSSIAQRFTTVGFPAGVIDLDDDYRVSFEAALEQAVALNLTLVPVDLEPFLAAARLLYEGPWLAERFAAFGDALEPDGPHLDPTVRSIVLPGRDLSAVEAFRAFDRLAEIRAATAGVWAGLDALLLPVAPHHPTHAEVAADPIGVNSRLGTFTNFANLLDLAAIAVPGPVTAAGLPFGVQFIGPAFTDAQLLDLADRWTGGTPADPAVRPGMTQVVLAGAHMSGLPLNPLVAGRGGRLLRRATTAEGYRMVRVPGVGVPKPALITASESTAALHVEVWEVPLQTLGQLAGEVVAPLRLGPVRLRDGTTTLGYLGDDAALGGAVDITASGGWRSYLEASTRP